MSRIATGFHGKLPACGDFVRAGLPRSFTDPWDAWLQSVLPLSQARLGAEWLPAWLEAPVWRFALAAGTCGPDAAAGLMLPSVDRVGRYFPLAIVRIGAGQPTDARFLVVAERAGRAAIAEDLLPAALAERLAQPEPEGEPALPILSPSPAVWWTDGGPRCPAAVLALPGLPDGAGFTAMLDAGGVPR